MFKLFGVRAQRRRPSKFKFAKQVVSPRHSDIRVSPKEEFGGEIHPLFTYEYSHGIAVNENISYSISCHCLKAYMGFTEIEVERYYL